MVICNCVPTYLLRLGVNELKNIAWLKKWEFEVVHLHLYSCITLVHLYLLTTRTYLLWEPRPEWAELYKACASARI